MSAPVRQVATGTSLSAAEAKKKTEKEETEEEESEDEEEESEEEKDAEMKEEDKKKEEVPPPVKGVDTTAAATAPAALQEAGVPGARSPPFRPSRRHARMAAAHTVRPISNGTLLRLLLKAGLPLLRRRGKKMRYVPPYIARGCHKPLRDLIDALVAELSHKAALLAEGRHCQTLGIEDVRYAARVVLGTRVF